MKRIGFLSLFAILFLIIPIVLNGCVVPLPDSKRTPMLPTALPENFVEPPVSDQDYYANSPDGVKQAEINKIMTTATRLWIKLVEPVYRHGEWQEELVGISGVGIFDGNLIRTVAHLFKKGKEIKEIYFIDKKRGKVELELLKLDRKTDVALLKMPDNFDYPMPVEIGDPSRIAYGDWLYIVTCSEFLPTLKSRIVSTPQLSLSEFKKEEIKEEINELDFKNIFWIPAGDFGPGDSGSPVFAILEETKKLELIGMLAYGYGREKRAVLAGVIKINVFYGK